MSEETKLVPRFSLLLGMGRRELWEQDENKRCRQCRQGVVVYMFKISDTCSSEIIGNTLVFSRAGSTT